MAEKILQEFNSDEEMAQESATIIDNLLSASREEALEEMLADIGAFLFYYIDELGTSYEVLDELKYNSLLKNDLDQMDKKASRMVGVRLRKRRSKRGKRTKTAKRGKKAAKRTQVSWKNGKARKVAWLVKVGCSWIQQTSDILFERLASCGQICIDDDEDYQLAVEAQKRGFGGTLLLSNALMVSNAIAIEADATGRGFNVRLSSTLREKIAAEDE